MCKATITEFCPNFSASVMTKQFYSVDILIIQSSRWSITKEIFTFKMQRVEDMKLYGGLIGKSMHIICRFKGTVSLYSPKRY